MNSDLRNGRARLLVGCAKEAFAARGYYATGVSYIVERAGIARGTFYQHIGNTLGRRRNRVFVTWERGLSEREHHPSQLYTSTRLFHTSKAIRSSAT